MIPFNTLGKQVGFFFLGVLAASGIIYLFTFSTYEEKEDLSHQRLFEQDYRIYALNVPSTMTFAGEKIPMELMDVKEKLDRELLVNTYWQSNSLLLFKRSYRWFPIIEPILKKNNVPDDFKYLALIESGLTNIVSPAGAAGFWQIMKTTAREGGLEVSGEIDERYNLEKSTQLACEYLLEAKEKFGTWSLAAASYNMGMAGLQKQLSRQGVSNYYDLLLGEETSRYVFRILAVKYIQENAENFGFRFRTKDLYPPISTRKVVLDSAVSDFSEWAALQGVNYKVLKYFNPWLRDSYIRKPSEPLVIQIPEEKYLSMLQLEIRKIDIVDTTSAE
ncbi:MAG: lytic transglycosylase domain-containing protein [Flavobacteriales bacterium]|nr:lytic transglycosylase domain-containing protein [Flavobacteriales bacterium]